MFSSTNRQRKQLKAEEYCISSSFISIKLILNNTIDFYTLDWIPYVCNIDLSSWHWWSIRNWLRYPHFQHITTHITWNCSQCSLLRSILAAKKKAAFCLIFIVNCCSKQWRLVLKLSYQKTHSAGAAEGAKYWGC